MKNKILGLALVVIIAIAIGGYVYPQSESQVTSETERVGANPGPNFFSRTFFNSGYTAGGRVATTTTAATYTTNIRDFYGSPTVIEWLPNISTTVSLSGTSTRDYVPNVGDVAEVYLRNASTTAGATITLAAVDTGVDLQFAEATGGDLVLNGLDWAKLTFIHTAQNTVTVIFDEMTEAD